MWLDQDSDLCNMILKYGSSSLISNMHMVIKSIAILNWCGRSRASNYKHNAFDGIEFHLPY